MDDRSTFRAPNVVWENYATQIYTTNSFGIFCRGPHAQSLRNSGHVTMARLLQIQIQVILLRLLAAFWRNLGTMICR